MRPLEALREHAQKVLKWVFPKDFLAKAGRNGTFKDDLADEFAKLLEGPRFRKMFDLSKQEDIDAYKTTLEALGATFGPSGRRAGRVNRSLIAQMLQGHP